MLGTAAGLNPYVTTALTALFGWRTELVTPNPSFAFVATSGTFFVAMLLLPLDLLADKFPGSGRHMDRIGWFIRPVAGGIVGATVTPDHIGALVGGLILGSAASAGTHRLRMYLRGRLQWRMLGFGRLVFGAYSDMSSGIIAAVVLISAPIGTVCCSLALIAVLLADRRWGDVEPT